VLNEFYPDRYTASVEFNELQNGLNVGAELIKKVKDELYKQIFVDTATWGLEYWEKAYGIKTIPSQSYAIRRSRVKALMRQANTATTELIKNVAEAFAQGSCDVTEYNDEYRFEITMTDKIGLPPNFEDFKAEIERVKPAHLTYTIIIKYRTHEQLKAYTHAQLKAYTHQQLREEAM
jgi:uncharacterized protein YmfQ (DUF2313 family)